MWAMLAKALVAAMVIVAISEIGKRQPTFAALVASLPLVSVLGMILLWYGRPDTQNMASHAEGTFWFVLPSLPMFPLMAWMLRSGFGFWFSLAAGCALTILLYLAMVQVGPRFGLRL